MDLKAFYDRFPYPPPVDDLDAYRRLWQDDARRRADFHLFWPKRKYRADFSILVAGCGTQQGAKHALRWPDAHVVAIDISETALAHEEALKARYGLGNLELRQLPVEHAAELAAGFDQIVCTGVLHHLKDPDAGLRALKCALAPEGAMHLMLYAPYGRHGLYMLQEFFRRAGTAPSAAGVRDAMAVLSNLPAAHPVASLLRDAPDFRTGSALADALLHPQDRAYSVPELFALLKKNGMAFARWLRQAPYSIHAGVMAHVAGTAHLASLPPEEQYAQAELFRGTMLHHSLIAHGDDNAGRVPDIFGDALLDAIPIRLPDTLLIEERLPPGAAAVLINRTHGNTDIVLPLDAHEKRLFGAIDGCRTVGEILRTAGYADAGAARALFEKLWWHDQVVFDASH